MSERDCNQSSPAREALQAEVGEFMERFEAEELRAVRKGCSANQMDSDGFVVTAGGQS